MDIDDAVRLLEPAVPAGPAEWADLGAGAGTFTRALARLLGPGSRIVAVDSDPGAVETLRRGWWERREAAGSGALVGAEDPGEGEGRVSVVAVVGDFRALDAVAELTGRSLDGLLFANALHFVADPGAVLGAVRERLAPGGRVVVVEYQGRRPNRWVPYPIDPPRLAELAAGAGFPRSEVVGNRPSAWGGSMYCAVLGS